MRVLHAERASDAVAPPLLRALSGRLSEVVRGEVRFSDGDRALYATDASNYRQVPIGVVIPRDVEDAVAAIGVCREFGAPLVHRGGGTSLAGQSCNAAVMIDFSKHVDRIEELDPVEHFAWVEPGVVLDSLRDRAERFGLTFGPDPSTHNHCTLGGMIGNNSCGVHSMMAGCTSANVEALEVLTYDGLRLTVGFTSDGELAGLSAAPGRTGALFRAVEAFRRRHELAIRTGFPDIPRRVSGYNLPALFEHHGAHLARALVGSEGTLVTVLRARVRLVKSPSQRVLVVLGFDDVFAAADAVPTVRESKPIGLEGLDEVLVEDMKTKGLHPERVKILPEGKGWLVVEFGGDTREEAEAQAHALVARMKQGDHPPSTKIFDDPRQEQIVWKVRESGLGATARVPGQHDTWEGWEDSSVPPEKLGAYLRDFQALLDQHQMRASLYGHFGQGCLHTRLPFDLRSPGGIAQFRKFIEAAAELVVVHGGSLSGEHGDGQSRAELLPKMFSPELIRAFEEWKAIWDPQDKMNPGKVVRPFRLDENLRLDVPPPREPRLHFRYPTDDGSFERALERCVGVGECRKPGNGTMCPSYMVTREEKHSTRGRAHLLFEMLRGETVKDGFRSEEVKEALDLCLSCKGCKGECPVTVDMATYKAEFLAHHYKGRLRPRSAYAFGLMFWWARVASLAPRLVNALLDVPPLARVVKWLGGVEPRRRIPRFAPVTFRDWWKQHRPHRTGGLRAVLFVDTWNNHFQPAVALAAVEALEAAGVSVQVPNAALCCGRPLYDYGMLGQAKRQLEQMLEVLRPAVRAGLPIVGLEPSCVSVLRDELLSFFPDDEDARALARQTMLLDDFLLHGAPGFTAPRLARPALVQAHCHQRAVLDFEAAMPLWKRVGLEARAPESGCCGMAGGFGYEAPHYEVSVQCGERVLLPAVRRASAETVLIADGFSCREQIEQQTGRRALHTAQVLKLAREASEGLSLPQRLEDAAAPWIPALRPRRRARWLAVAALGAAALWWFGKRGRR
jgi:FAD/FMN-containing dehydrogenase/Fe-S oxidoreductase